MSRIYRSPYEAYPFLADEDNDLRCDFEILTDRMASMTGLLASQCPEEALRAELLKIEELIYHFNPTLRTFLSVTSSEIESLKARVEQLQQITRERLTRFVLPRGSERAGHAHVLRADSKALVRMMYRYVHRSGHIEDEAFDFANLLSGYFFFLAVHLNSLDGIAEIEYESRNYKFTKK